MKHLIHSLILLIAMGGCAINGNRLVEIFIDVDEALEEKKKEKPEIP